MTPNALRARALLPLVVAVATLFVPPAATSMAQTGIQCQDGVDNDGDGLVDLQDPGCSDAADGTETVDPSPYDIPVRIVPVAVPVITIVGGVAKSGAVDVKRFRVQGAKGTVVTVQCRGDACPFRATSVTMKTASVSIPKLERRLKPKLDLTVRAAIPGSLGKFLKYQIRSGQAPKRTDSCVLNGRVRDCFMTP